MSFEPLPEALPPVRHRAPRFSGTLREWREERARKDGYLAFDRAVHRLRLDQLDSSVGAGAADARHYGTGLDPP